jgi:hypothetical protein
VRLSAARFGFDARGLSLLLTFQSRQLQLCGLTLGTQASALIAKLSDLDSLFA